MLLLMALLLQATLANRLSAPRSATRPAATDRSAGFGAAAAREPAAFPERLGLPRPEPPPGLGGDRPEWSPPAALIGAAGGALLGALIVIDDCSDDVCEPDLNAMLILATTGLGALVGMAIDRGAGYPPWPAARPRLRIGVLAESASLGAAVSWSGPQRRRPRRLGARGRRRPRSPPWRGRPRSRRSTRRPGHEPWSNRPPEAVAPPGRLWPRSFRCNRR
jgi:hypothetical protein